MGIDQKEAQRRRKVDAPKYSTKQPIAAIEKRVIDSEAFAKLPPSAVVVLLLMSRNLAKGRNGHVFLSKDDAGRHGIERNTLYKAFKVLTASGFIFPTAAGGHGKCATYALTWLPMSKDTDGLLVDDYRSCAWRDHESELIEWKKRGGKKCTSSGRFPAQPTQTVDKFPPRVVDVFPPLEVNTNTQRNRAHAENDPANVTRLDAYLAKLRAAGLGAGKHAERCSVRLRLVAGAAR